jgi:anaerobic selenocysteine-containing dehydrogenase
MMFDEEGSFKHTRDAVIEGKPYPIKGWLDLQNQPHADRRQSQQDHADDQQARFHGFRGHTMSDTAWMADLVLPAPSYLERQDPISAFLASSTCSGVITRDPIVPAHVRVEARLLDRQGTGQTPRSGMEHFDFTIEDFRKAQLKDLPEVAAALEKDGVYNIVGPSHGLHEGKRFKTRSGKDRTAQCPLRRPRRRPHAGLHPAQNGAGKSVQDRGRPQRLYHPERQHQQQPALGARTGKHPVDPSEAGPSADHCAWRESEGRQPGGKRCSQGGR